METVSGTGSWVVDSAHKSWYLTRYVLLGYKDSIHEMQRWRIYQLLDSKYYIVDCSKVADTPCNRPKIGPYENFKTAEFIYFALHKQTEIFDMWEAM